jgi:hypothetical protein
MTEGFSRKTARLQISTFDGKVSSSSLKLDINGLDRRDALSNHGPYPTLNLEDPEAPKVTEITADT